MGITKAKRERKQLSRRVWAKQAADGQAPQLYKSNSKQAPVDMRTQRDEARQQLQAERERNAQQQQQMDQQAQEHAQLQQQVEEHHGQQGEQEQEHKALHEEAQQQLAEVQQFFVQELEQLVQQRAQEQRERVVEQQQFAEVLQFLQGQRELIKDLEEELRVLEARSREQEQAMFELNILKHSRSMERVGGRSGVAIKRERSTSREGNMSQEDAQESGRRRVDVDKREGRRGRLVVKREPSEDRSSGFHAGRPQSQRLEQHDWDGNGRVEEKAPTNLQGQMPTVSHMQSKLAKVEASLRTILAKLKQQAGV